MTEREFLDTIIKEAKANGWLVFHQLPAMRQNGRYVSATQGHTGFPDLVLAHAGRHRLVFAELKVGKNKETDEQKVWLDALDAIAEYGDQPEVYVWRPEHMPAIISLLYGRPLAA